MIQLPVKKLSPNAILPSQGSEFSAGYDLYACIHQAIKINPSETVMIPTGLALEIPIGYVGLIYARSSVSTQKGLAPANKVGVCDSDYRGEYQVPLYNHAMHPALVLPNERIAQLVITPCLAVEFQLVEELSTTKRNQSGFGSTGL